MRMILGMTSILGGALVGCMADAGDNTDEGLSSTEQAVSTFSSHVFSSSTNLNSFDLPWQEASSTCVMSAVLGDLGEGGEWDVQDIPSLAQVIVGPNGNYIMFAHGGAYTNQTNDRVWAGNHVKVGATCVPYRRSLEGTYESSEAPHFLGPTAPGRRCFLNSIVGGGQIFTHTDDYVIVKQVGTTDTRHPSAGWYIEGNLRTNPYTGQQAQASAFCVDFPSVTHEWSDSVAGPAAPVVTTGSGIKMCGLYAVRGAFNIDSTSNGVMLNPPATQTGNWVLTVSAGKAGSYRCVQ